MVNGLLGNYHTCRSADRFSGAEVTVPAWMRSARDVHPNAVAGSKLIRRRPQIDFDPQASIGLQLALVRLDAQQSIADIDGCAVRCDITQASYEVGVRCARTHISRSRTGPITSIGSFNGAVV
jgi:hypothetical protein